MNKYIGSILSGLAIGTSLGVFVVFAIYLRHSLEYPDISENTEFVESSTVDFIFERIVTNHEYITIAGVARNKSDRRISETWVSANLFDSIGLFGSCQDRLNGLEPMEERPFALRCYAFKSEDAPKELSVTTKISSVEAVK
jgi:hypothetical protein